jgi:membrane glycosyltransferase
MGLSAGAQGAWLAVATFVLLFLSKILAVVDLALTGGVARFGGWFSVCAGVVLETLFSVLLAPVLMLFHAKFVVSTILGQGVRWATQRRNAEAGIAWGEAFATHWGHALTGLVWALALARFAPGLLAWMSPVLAGMVLSIPFSALTAPAGFGLAARRAGLFVTPEEIDPPAELRDLEATLASAEGRPLPVEGPDRGLTSAVVDPYVNAVHRCQLRDRRGRAESIREYFRMTQELLLREGPTALKKQEKLALLNDAESLDRLHREVWMRPAAELAPWWRDALARHTAA